MPRVLVRCFDNGFHPDSGGLVLFIDLVTRGPMSEIMPWWNLPETLRAAMLSWRVAGSDMERTECLRVLSACHNAFAQHYVRPELHLMAYQTRSIKGEPVAIIPATPDADPGYHTGCSVLDFLNAYDDLPTP